MSAQRQERARKSFLQIVLYWEHEFSVEEKWNVDRDLPTRSNKPSIPTEAESLGGFKTLQPSISFSHELERKQYWSWSTAFHGELLPNAWILDLQISSLSKGTRVIQTLHPVNITAAAAAFSFHSGSSETLLAQLIHLLTFFFSLLKREEFNKCLWDALSLHSHKREQR